MEKITNLAKSNLIKGVEDVRIRSTLENHERSIFNWRQTEPFNFVEKGDVNALKNYLKINYYSPNDDKGNTLMHHAVRFDNVEMIYTLKEMNFSIEPRNRMFRTPLHLAAELNKVNAMRALLQLGADVEARDVNGSTAAHLAARSEGIEGLRVLRAFQADFGVLDKWEIGPLMHAASANKPENVAEIISYGAKVDAADKLGNTALYYAAWIGREEVANILCLNGANPMHGNNKGFSPLDIAKAEGNTKMVEMLSHFVQNDALLKIVDKMEVRLDKIKNLLTQREGNALTDDMLKYNIVRASARLMDVENFLTQEKGNRTPRLDAVLSPIRVARKNSILKAPHNIELERGTK